MLLNWLSRRLAAYLSKQVTRHSVRTSTWDALQKSLQPGDVLLVEADLEEGIRTLPLSFYRHTHTRVCRPVGLSKEDIRRLADYSKSRLGHQYDMKNVFDLARYLFSTPPVPVRYRHKLLAFGSGDPTRAICSTFIAEGFQQLRYPILPVVKTLPSDDPDCEDCVYEQFRVRHHSLFTPRDFDASPYFRIIKPTLEENFDYRAIDWSD